MIQCKLLRIQALLFSLVAGLQPCDAPASRLLPRIHRGGFRYREDGRAVWAMRSGSEPRNEL